MRSRAYQIIIILLFTIPCVNAQIFTPVIDETSLEFRVKQIDEFFSRFNYDTDYKGNPPQNPTDNAEREKNMLTLLDLDQFIGNDGKIDSIARKFLDYVINNNLKIRYEDSTWHAMAIGTLIYEGKEYDVTFRLETERIKGVMFKWVIADVQSSIFMLPTETENTITISPAEHGISFMTLPETLNLNRSAIGSSFKTGYKRSNLAIFDYLMSKQKIRLNPITRVSFHFELGNSQFTVERTEKEKGYNQGWLIKEIILTEKETDEK